MGVVAETMTALVVAGEVLRKFGGDSMAELVRNRDGYLAHIADTPSAAIAADHVNPGDLAGPAASGS